MKTKAVIEAGTDGMFGIYAPDLTNTISGSGPTVEEAVRDFEAAYRDAVAVFEEEGLPVPEELRGVQFVYQYDVAALFAAFPFLNMSRTAEAMGINASVMRRYACAGGRIARSRKQAIEDGIRAIGERLCRVRIA